MRYLFILISITVIASCNNDDNSNNGQCWGSIKEVGADGTVYADVRFQEDCEKCGKRIYWECPEPGTCGEYTSALGTWECE